MFITTLQKIAIRTIAPEKEPENDHDNHSHNDDDSDDKKEDDDSQEEIMEVDSLKNLFKLLGMHNDPDTGFLIIERGYQTEELAHQTVEWIWCGLEHHCPEMARDIWDDATIQDCESILNLLLGFIHRKRPIP